MRKPSSIVFIFYTFNMRKPSIAFVFLLHCLMSSLVWSNKNDITRDKFALLAFKSFISSDPYSFLANWSVSSSPCIWDGVTCNVRHGRVRSLNLSGMNLTGIISPQLGNLSFLVELDLSSNNFHGQIPKEVVSLHRLKLFNLSYNDFHGQIPSSLSNLSSLEVLDWNYNSIKGTIPLEIGNLKHLKVLRLSVNELSGEIPQTISNLSSLERLSLSYNTLSGICFYSFN